MAQVLHDGRRDRDRSRGPGYRLKLLASVGARFPWPSLVRKMFPDDDEAAERRCYVQRWSDGLVLPKLRRSERAARDDPPD